MNGLVRTLAQRHPQLVWLVNARYVPAVRQMMGDVPGLQITGTCGYPDVKDFWLPRWPDAIRLGFFRPEDSFDQLHWDQEFYRHSDVPFDRRWTDFRFAEPLPPPIFGDTLIHEDPSRDYFVKRELLPRRARVIRPGQYESILDWIPELLGAKELHFIDSAFLNLAESLFALGELRHTRLVFHRYAKKYPGEARWPMLRAPWEVIE